MLPPIVERRVEAPGDEPAGEALPSQPPPEPIAAAPPTARGRRRGAGDLIALYAARAEATAIDLRPLIDERRERRPTEAAPVTLTGPAVKPRPIGRGTAEHRDAVRRARVDTAPPAPRRARDNHPQVPKVWRRWLPTAGLAKIAALVGTTVRGLTGPRKRGRPRARRVVQGRA